MKDCWDPINGASVNMADFLRLHPCPKGRKRGRQDEDDGPCLQFRGAGFFGPPRTRELCEDARGTRNEASSFEENDLP